MTAIQLPVQRINRFGGTTHGSAVIHGGDDDAVDSVAVSVGFSVRNPTAEEAAAQSGLDVTEQALMLDVTLTYQTHDGSSYTRKDTQGVAAIPLDLLADAVAQRLMPDRSAFTAADTGSVAVYDHIDGGYVQADWRSTGAWRVGYDHNTHELNLVVPASVRLMQNLPAANTLSASDDGDLVGWLNSAGNFALWRMADLHGFRWTTDSSNGTWILSGGVEAVDALPAVDDDARYSIGNLLFRRNSGLYELVAGGAASATANIPATWVPGHDGDSGNERDYGFTTGTTSDYGARPAQLPSTITSIVFSRTATWVTATAGTFGHDGLVIDVGGQQYPFSYDSTTDGSDQFVAFSSTWLITAGVAWSIHSRSTKPFTAPSSETWSLVLPVTDRGLPAWVTDPAAAIPISKIPHFQDSEVHSGPGAGIFVARSNGNGQSVVQGFNPAFDLDDHVRGTFIGSVQMTLTEVSATTIGWDANGTKTLIAPLATLFGSQLAASTVRDNTNHGIQVLEAPIYNGASELGQMELWLSRDAANVVAYQWRYTGASGSINFNMGNYLYLAFFHNDAGGSAPKFEYETLLDQRLTSQGLNNTGLWQSDALARNLTADDDDKELVFEIPLQVTTAENWPGTVYVTSVRAGNFRHHDPYYLQIQGEGNLSELNLRVGREPGNLTNDKVIIQASTVSLLPTVGGARVTLKSVG